MAEEKALDGAEQKPDGNQGEVKMIPKSEAEIAFKKRDEANAKAQALEAQLNKIKEDELAKQGDYKSLVDQKEKEIIGLKSELESAKPFKEKWTAFETQEKETIKKSLGDKWKPTFESLDLNTLKDMSLAIVAQGKDGSPHNPAHSGGNGSKKIENMTNQEFAEFRRLGGNPLIN